VNRSTQFPNKETPFMSEQDFKPGASVAYKIAEAAAPAPSRPSTATSSRSSATRKAPRSAPSTPARKTANAPPDHRGTCAVPQIQGLPALALGP